MHKGCEIRRTYGIFSYARRDKLSIFVGVGVFDPKVRFFGDSLAMVYGRETSARKAKDGTEQSRCLIWTDTWFKRNGNWQIIAAQDTRFECK